MPHFFLFASPQAIPGSPGSLAQDFVCKGVHDLSFQALFALDVARSQPLDPEPESQSPLALCRSISVSMSISFLSIVIHSGQPPWDAQEAKAKLGAAQGAVAAEAAVAAAEEADTQLGPEVEQKQCSCISIYICMYVMCVYIYIYINTYTFLFICPYIPTYI